LGGGGGADLEGGGKPNFPGRPTHVRTGLPSKGGGGPARGKKRRGGARLKKPKTQGAVLLPKKKKFTFRGGPHFKGEVPFLGKKGGPGGKTKNSKNPPPGKKPISLSLKNVFARGGGFFFSVKKNGFFSRGRGAPGGGRGPTSKGWTSLLPGLFLALSFWEKNPRGGGWAIFFAGSGAGDFRAFN